MKKFFITLMCVIMVVCFMPTVAMAETAGSESQYTGTNTYAAAVCEVKGSADKFVSVSCDILRNGTKLNRRQMDGKKTVITAIKYKESGSKDDYETVPENWINNLSGGNFYFAISEIDVGSYDIQITFDFTGIFNNSTKDDKNDDEEINVKGLVANTTLDIIPDIDIKNSEEPLVLTISDVTASYTEIGQRYLPIPFKVMCGGNDVSGVVEIKWEKVEGATMGDSDPEKESDGTYTFGHLYPYQTQICGTVPITAWAVYSKDESTKTSEKVKFNVTMTDCNQMFAAQVGNVGYNTLEDAITAATPDQTVTLLKDVTLSSMITLNKSITLDLNGKKLCKNDGNSIVQVVNGATLTIDGTKAGSTVYGRINVGIADNNNGNVIMNGGTYHCTDGQTVLHINGTCTKSNVTISGVDITSPTDNGIQLNGAGTFLIENSKITGATAVYIKSGTTTIRNCTFTGTMSPANYSYNGNGSNATGDAIVVDACNYPGGDPTVNIVSGSFTGTKAAVGFYSYNNGKGTISITGGTFSSDVKQYMSSVVNEYKKDDGSYIVSATSPANSSGKNSWIKGENGIYTETYVASYIPPTPTTPTDKPSEPNQSGTTTTTDISNTTTTSNGTTTATVDKTTADKIVDKAVENKSTEVVIDATANSTTAADSTTTAQVTIPTETLGAIAEKTEADVTIKTDVAEVKMDNAAAAAVSEQAEGDTVKIIAEKVKEDATEVHFELKVVCSNGTVISDFKGGNVAVTVTLPKEMADKKVVCVYIDDNGHMSKVEGQKNADGTYTFVTGHFSTYAIMAEEEADAAIAAQTEAIKNIEIKVSTKLDATKAGKKGIKVTWKTADGKKLDGVEFFRSVKKNSGYGKKAFFTSKKAGTTGYYLNTKSLKKGTRYYYRVRGYVLVDGQKVYTDWSNKGIRTFR